MKKGSWMSFVVLGLMLMVAVVTGCTSSGENDTDATTETENNEGVTSETEGDDSTMTETEDGVTTWYVGPQQVDCDSGAGQQMCLQVKETPDGEYTLFYGNIVGFEYEPGFNYELKVQSESSADAPADASTITYKLVEIVSKSDASMTETEDGVTTWYVGPQQVDCDGGAGQQTCLQVKETPDGEYTLFYGNIEGFEYESGFNYELKVQSESSADAPADASTITYKLVEVVSKTENAEAVVPTMNLLNGSWTLATLILDGQPVALPSQPPVTLEIQDESVAGSAGCNNYNGTATFDAGNVTFGQMATTRKACPESLMKLEQLLLGFFGQATNFSTERGATLELRNADSSSMAIFTKPTTAETFPLVSYLDGEWTTSAVTVNGEATTLPYPNYAKLIFDGNQLAGNTGCNDYSGSVTFDQGTVDFGTIGGTRKMCVDERVMAFENAFFSLFDSAQNLSTNPGVLTLSSEDGSTTATFNRARQETLYVGPQQADCVGVGPQKCLQVKESPDGEYRNFFGNIKGFEFEEGFNYELTVRVITFDNVPADASTMQYELVEVVSKEPAAQ